MCFKKRIPKPLPSAAPSMIPGNIGHYKTFIIAIRYNTQVGRERRKRVVSNFLVSQPTPRRAT